MKRFVSLVLALGGAAACGDNLNPGGGDDDTDAVQIDAPNPDAMPDAPIDAPPPPPYSATVSITETAVLNPTGNTILGQGITIIPTYTETATAVPPAFDQMPGTPFGCKVFVFDTAAELATVPGVNEGVVQVTVDNPPITTPPSQGAEDPPFPACVFQAGAGYVCPDLTSSQAITVTNSVTLTAVGSNARLTVAAGTATFDAADVGRYVKFSNTTNPLLDSPVAAFPILFTGANCPVTACGSNEAFIGGAPAAAVTMGMMTTLAGAGPLPTLADPGMLDNAATVSITAIGNMQGGGNHLGNWTMTTNAGDDFAVTNTIADLMRAIPLNGNAFTIECDAAGNMCGTSVGTVLNIVTTNGSVTGLPATAMPPPDMTNPKRVNIRCAAIGPTSITVPAQASAFLMTSGATRIQTTLIRANLGTAVPANSAILPIAGHALVGFTTP